MATTEHSIFCDGACPGNGTKTARASWAFAYWPHPLHTVGGPPATEEAAPLDPLTPQTNQRAELTALLRALEWAKEELITESGSTITIYTDSVYAMKCTTEWGPKWKRDGWTRSSGKPLENLDLVKPLVDLWQSENTADHTWVLEHVPGHSKKPGPEKHGNDWVDAAAVAALSP